VTLDCVSLPFYGITKDPNSSEFMMVTGLAEGSLRKLLAKSFTKLSWLRKLRILLNIIGELKILHEKRICHKDLHSRNTLMLLDRCYLTDFKSSEKIYGVLGYIAPEVLKGKPYRSHADIYSFGIIMTELSSGFPPYFNKKMSKHDFVMSIGDGIRPDFGKGTPEIYKDLANKCMNDNFDERPTAGELEKIISYWINCLSKVIGDDDAKRIKVEFDIADKVISGTSNLELQANS
jgi:serine/threonine protein kinase